MKLLGLAALTLLLGPLAHAEVTPKDPLPKKILTCGGSVITDIGSRLEGDPEYESGVSLNYRNGGHQVDYSKNEAVLNSKKGDHVLICLVLIPKDCPPGDDRGRVYTTTNLRTLESWTMSDSQHSCGGA